MAKLNGVKVVKEAIEYNGVEYEKVDGKAQVGDIVRSNCEDVDHFPNGAFYTVVDDSDGPCVVDEDGG
ncbi:hypothetical protein [Paenibacillus apiarius]|uniref:hypothetical protein n=1 Tax=Paenibacillus apiarius TaxID=46240 RepID=UPI003B3A7530